MPSRNPTSSFDVILGKPSITPFSFPEKPLVGSQIKVMCFAGGGSNLLWLKDGIALRNGTHDINLQYFNGFLVLSIDNVQVEHTGNYTCAARLGDSESRFSAHLEVSAPPQWISVPNEIVVVKSSRRLTLKCDASGHPRPNITWLRNKGQSRRFHFSRYSLVASTIGIGLGFIPRCLSHLSFRDSSGWLEP